MKKNTRSSLLFLLVVLLTAVVALAPLFPMRVVPVSAPPNAFSAERALVHLPIIAKDPHPAGSEAQGRVRDYLVRQLADLGLEVEVQQAPGVENVVARLGGTDTSGAILLQAHYDSLGGPGAADNGSGVSALLEVVRALKAGPALGNTIIVLFDDSEELPGPFTGTKAFIREHRWMDDVRVAVGMDTAVRGFICTDDTGPNNGWLVRVLARAYTGGAWTSLCGGGGYDTEPFKQAGIRVLELEDNYPFHEQHTSDDVPGIVRPASVQQLGEQVLSVVREMGYLDLAETSGVQQAYLYVPGLGLAYYPESWALPLALISAILLVTAFVLAIRRRLVSWDGLGMAALATMFTSGLAGLGSSAVWKAAPDLFGWETRRWQDWPEVIPPNGWTILILTNLAVLAVSVAVYRYSRRWNARTGHSLFGLFIILLLSITAAVSDPRGAIIFTWPVLAGALAWIAVVTLTKRGTVTAVDIGSLLAAILVILYIFPLIPGIFMGDGTKSVPVTSAVWAVILAIVLPAVDGLFRLPKPRP